MIKISVLFPVIYKMSVGSGLLGYSHRGNNLDVQKLVSHSVNCTCIRNSLFNIYVQGIRNYVCIYNVDVLPIGQRFQLGFLFFKLGVSI